MKVPGFQYINPRFQYINPRFQCDIPNLWNGQPETRPSACIAITASQCYTSHPSPQYHKQCRSTHSTFADKTGAVFRTTYPVSQTAFQHCGQYPTTLDDIPALQITYKHQQQHPRTRLQIISQHQWQHLRTTGYSPAMQITSQYYRQSYASAISGQA